MNSAGKSSHHHHQHRHQKQPGAKTSSRNHKPRASRESNSSTGTSAPTSSKTASSSKTRDRLTEENILIHRLISYYYNLHRIRKGEQPAKAMANKGGDMGDGESYDKSKNFLRQFRDKNSRQLKKFSATQFMEVWNHYDSDGKLLYLFIFVNLRECGFFRCSFTFNIILCTFATLRQNSTRLRNLELIDFTFVYLYQESVISALTLKYRFQVYLSHQMFALRRNIYFKPCHYNAIFDQLLQRTFYLSIKLHFTLFYTFVAQVH